MVTTDENFMDVLAAHAELFVKSALLIPNPIDNMQILLKQFSKQWNKLEEGKQELSRMRTRLPKDLLMRLNIATFVHDIIWPPLDKKRCDACIRGLNSQFITGDKVSRPLQAILQNMLAIRLAFLFIDSKHNSESTTTTDAEKFFRKALKAEQHTWVTGLRKREVTHQALQMSQDRTLIRDLYGKTLGLIMVQVSAHIRGIGPVVHENFVREELEKWRQLVHNKLNADDKPRLSRSMKNQQEQQQRQESVEQEVEQEVSDEEDAEQGVEEDQEVRQVDEVQGQVQIMEQQDESGQEQVEEHEKDKEDVDELQVEMEELQEEVEELQEEVDGLQEEVEELQEEAEELQAETEELQEDVDELQEETSVSQENSTALQEEVADTQEEAADVQEEAAGVQEEAAGVQEEASDIQQNPTDIQDEQRELEEQDQLQEGEQEQTDQDNAGDQGDAAHFTRSKGRAASDASKATTTTPSGRVKRSLSRKTGKQPIKLPKPPKAARQVVKPTKRQRAAGDEGEAEPGPAKTRKVTNHWKPHETARLRELVQNFQYQDSEIVTKKRYYKWAKMKLYDKANGDILAARSQVQLKDKHREMTDNGRHQKRVEELNRARSQAKKAAASEVTPT